MSEETLEIDINVSSNRQISDGLHGMTISFNSGMVREKSHEESAQVSTNKVAVPLQKEFSCNNKCSEYNKRDDGSYKGKALNKLDVSTQGTKICKFYQKNRKCKYESNCYFSHDISRTANVSEHSQEETGEQNLHLRRINAKSKCCEEAVKFNRTEKISDDKNVQKTKELDGSYLNISSSNDVYCKYFMKKMGCKFGDDCPYKHYRSVCDAGALSVNNLSHIDNSIGEKTKLNEFTGTIKYNEQELLLGNERKNLKHDATMESQVEHFKQGKIDGSQKPVKICKWYLGQDGCRKGDNCKFIHSTKREMDTSNVSNDSYNIKRNNSRTPPASDTRKEVTTKKEYHSGKDNNAVSHRQGRRCRFFLTSQGCKLKDKCSFLHEQSKDNFIGKYADNCDLDVKKDASKDGKHRYESNISGAKNGNELAKLDGYDPNSKDAVNNSKRDTPLLSAKESEGKASACSSEDHYLVLQKTEFNQLERRFSSENKCSLIQSEPSTIYLVTFEPSDPDWAFVVTEFVLRVEFPAEYPKKLFKVSIEDNDFYPDGFTSFLNDGLQIWFNERQATRQENDLAFRPFLKWLDRNIGSLVLDAGRKVKLLLDAERCGISLIPHKEIFQNDLIPTSDSNGKQDDIEPSKDMNNVNDKELNNSEGNAMVSLPMGKDTEADETICKADETSELNTLLSPNVQSTNDNANNNKLSMKVKSGTEAKFSHLVMNENVGTLMLKNVLLIIQCSRCKTRGEFKLHAKTKAMSACKKCHAGHSAVFYPEIVHQYSPIAGYLHLDGCKAFDLVLIDSIITIQCLNCSKENMKKGMAYGRKGDYWCQSCHAKMEMNAQAMKFTQLQKSGEPVQSMKAPAAKKAVKYPNIKEGECLPSNGTCKHYKKSYRWLRFPCCGKVYPCDICHEESEENDHEMLFATRMICGFCSKEQPYSKEKPCIKCNSNVTKSRSSHWEGGQGCRNKTSMSRKDRRKTTGLAKTVSRKKANE